MFGVPGSLDPLAVIKKNVIRSMMPHCGGVRDAKSIRIPKAELCWKSDGKGVPKVTEVLVKGNSPARNLEGR